MGGVLAVLLLMFGSVLMIGFIAFGAQWLDNRENRLAVRKKRVLQLERTLDEIESLVVYTLTVDPHDLTANQVASVFRKSRAKELKRR